MGRAILYNGAGPCVWSAGLGFSDPRIRGSRRLCLAFKPLTSTQRLKAQKGVVIVIVYSIVQYSIVWYV